VRTRAWMLPLVVTVSLLVAGCARRRTETTTDSTLVDTTALRYPSSSEPMETTGTRTGSKTDTANVTPSADRPKVDGSSPTAKILSQISQEEFDLGVLIQEKRFAGVRSKVTNIYSLVTQAVTYASDLPEEKKTSLSTSRTNVRVLTARLAQAADAGDAELANSLFKDLQNELRTIEGILSA
jgi:hypothetical protein